MFDHIYEKVYLIKKLYYEKVYHDNCRVFLGNVPDDGAKHFNVQRDEDIIDKLRTQVDVYEDSVYHYHKMVEIASYKDSIARQLIDESNRIKMHINSKKSK